MSLMRLQKYLSAAGICSRRRGETYIKDGRVRVNSVTVTELGTKVDPEVDRVEVDGKPVRVAEKLVYIALNKPAGHVTSCSREDGKIVIDLVEIHQRIYPVGRLDKESTGLLLLTNDGRLHHRLSHPSFDHEKEYQVNVASPIPDGALAHMAKGMPMMGTRTRPARVRRVAPACFRITLKEGKNRQIRRMVRKVGNRVTDLKRIRIGSVFLGELEVGKWRYLTEKERVELIKRVVA